MMHKAWSSIEEVPYCFSRSSVKFQGHTALKFVEFDPNSAFPDCNSSLNSPMAMKCCTKLETAKGRCPMPYCFPRSSIKFQGHRGQNITDFDPNWAFPDYRPVAAFKSLRFALFLYNPINFLAIPYPKSLVNLVVEVGTRYNHQILFAHNWKLPCCQCTETCSHVSYHMEKNTHILQGYFTGTGAIIWLPQCQWRNHEVYV